MVLGERELSWERVFVLVENSCLLVERVLSWEWERGVGPGSGREELVLGVRVVLEGSGCPGR